MIFFAKYMADVLYDLNQPIDIKENKTLKLSGHKIEITTWNGFHLSTGADLKIDGDAGGGEIVLAQQGSLFYMNGGSLTIDGGSYVVFDPISIVVLIDISTAGGKVEINGRSFQDIRGKMIYSRSEKSANPPQVIINGGIFTSNIESVERQL